MSDRIVKETFEEFSARAHSGHWSFDDLAEWYFVLDREHEELMEIMRHVSVAIDMMGSNVFDWERVLNGYKDGWRDQVSEAYKEAHKEIDEYNEEEEDE